MRFVVLFLACIIFFGCSTASKKNISKKDNLTVEETIAKQEQEIENLKELLVQKERQLLERDVKVERMRNQLEGFGVFE